MAGRLLHFPRNLRRSCRKRAKQVCRARPLRANGRRFHQGAPSQRFVSSARMWTAQTGCVGTAGGPLWEGNRGLGNLRVIEFLRRAQALPNGVHRCLPAGQDRAKPHCLLHRHTFSSRMVSDHTAEPCLERILNLHLARPADGISENRMPSHGCPPCPANDRVPKGSQKVRSLPRFCRDRFHWHPVKFRVQKMNPATMGAHKFATGVCLYRGADESHKVGRSNWQAGWLSVILLASRSRVLAQACFSRTPPHTNPVNARPMRGQSCQRMWVSQGRLWGVRRSVK